FHDGLDLKDDLSDVHGHLLRPAIGGPVEGPGATPLERAPGPRGCPGSRLGGSRDASGGLRTMIPVRFDGETSLRAGDAERSQLDPAVSLDDLRECADQRTPVDDCGVVAVRLPDLARSLG